MDNSKIGQTIYIIDNHRQLYTYTASWCNPCKKIKPIVDILMTANKYKVSSFDIIEKTEFKSKMHNLNIPDPKIPFFIIFENKEKVIASIQTSDETKLKTFLVEHHIINSTLPELDNDF